MAASLLFKDESYGIMGACFSVYTEMGCGFLEAVYQECLAMEFANRNIPFTAQPSLILSYRGVTLTQRYQPDFICYGSIIVELKTASNLVNEHRAQMINYLHCTDFSLGLLINFGHHPKLESERFANA